MARILPDGWEQIEAANTVPFEIATLRRFAAELPDDYLVFHGVHWTRVEHEFSVYGEIDFVVVGPAGQVLAIEQKNGPLEETPTGLVKRYRDKEKRVPSQIQRSIEALQRRFRSAHGARGMPLDYLLYCPDHRLQSPATAGIAPERIVDAGGLTNLVAVVVSLVGSLVPFPGISAESVRAYLSDELELVADTNALVGQASSWVTRLSGGLATWARQLTFDPFRLRVIGPAGSGKTQLALKVLTDAAAQGLRARYVGFNKPLADHIARIAPRSAEVATFHALCDQRYRRTGAVPDFRDPKTLELMTKAFVDAVPASDERFDVLVVDEGQDFLQPWADALLNRLTAGARAWWLEDPIQNLYGRTSVDLPGWVEMHADANYRTPRDILEEIGMLIDLGTPVRTASPVRGDGIETATYADFTSLKAATVAAVARGKAAGFKSDDIVILTYCGRERSQLFPFDTLGRVSLRRFDGTYDAEGNPTLQAGEVLLETVFRFKGQSAPYVILTEMDAEEFDEAAMHRLYVGATRAQMRLSLVMSERMQSLLAARLS